MTYTNFKDQVASYLSRSASAVVTAAGQDLILSAMNDARRWAQREYTFDGNATQAFVSLSMVPKSLLLDFKTLPDLVTTIVAKRVDSLFEFGTTLVGATAVYYPTHQIELRRRNALKTFIPNDVFASSLSSPSLVQFAYVQGTRIVHTNLTAPVTVMADIIEFLPDHAGDAVEDIFLTYYVDWLRFATLANLNVWLKDAERTGIDLNVTNSLWMSVKRHDAQQALSTDDLSLD